MHDDDDNGDDDDDDDDEPDPTCLQTLAKHWVSSALSLRAQTFLMMMTVTVRTVMVTVTMTVAVRTKTMLGDLSKLCWSVSISELAATLVLVISLWLN